MALDGRRALFISYNGMFEPLGQTQVIPYLTELAKRGVVVTLLSFEKPESVSSENCEWMLDSLRERNIDWHWLRYHRRPTLAATAFDVAAGIRFASRLVRKNAIELVHARAYIPATIALWLRRRYGVKMIFDLRGLMAEEYVDANHWKQGGVPYRVTKATERRILANTDAIVTLTDRIWPIIQGWEGLQGRKVQHQTIPCCVDLSLFKFSAEDRKRRRRELGLSDQFTIVYSGSLDGWYVTDKMADFFSAFINRRPDAHLLWLTMGSRERVKELMRERAIAERNFSVARVLSSDVPSYLSVADAGISFIKPCFSKLASSPTKNAEYLACGLPLILNAGIGDSDVLATDWNVGAMVTEFSEESYMEAIDKIERLASEREIRTRARSVAKQLFSLVDVGAERYVELYERVLADQEARG